MLYVRRGSNCAFAADFFLPKEFPPACKRGGFWEWRELADCVFFNASFIKNVLILLCKEREQKKLDKIRGGVQ